MGGGGWCTEDSAIVPLYISICMWIPKLLLHIVAALDTGKKWFQPFPRMFPVLMVTCCSTHPKWAGICHIYIHIPTELTVIWTEAGSIRCKGKEQSAHVTAYKKYKSYNKKSFFFLWRFHSTNTAPLQNDSCMLLFSHPMKSSNSGIYFSRLVSFREDNTSALQYL